MFLQANWAVISQAPWVFVTIVVLFGGGGILLGRFWRAETVGILQSRLEMKNDQIERLQRIQDGGAKSDGQRSLSADQRRKLANAIAEGGVALTAVSILFSVHGGDETRHYAEEIVSVFRSQGSKGQADVPMDDDPRLSGVKIWYQPEATKDPNAIKLASALDAAIIEYEWAPHEPPYSGARAVRVSKARLTLATTALRLAT